MPKTPKPVRRAGRLAARAAKEEIKKPSVTRTGSRLQTKSEKAFVSTYKADTNNYVGKKIAKTVDKMEKKKKP
jgi:hypothetical protein